MADLWGSVAIDKAMHPHFSIDADFEINGRANYKFNCRYEAAVALRDEFTALVRSMEAHEAASN